MAHGFAFDDLYYDCNTAVDETRLVPAALLLLGSMLVWRWRKPAGRGAGAAGDGLGPQGLALAAGLAFFAAAIQGLGVDDRPGGRWIATAAATGLMLVVPTLLWRFRRGGPAQGWREALGDAALGALLLALAGPCWLVAQDQPRAWWGALLVVAALMLIVLNVEAGTFPGPSAAPARTGLLRRAGLPVGCLVLLATPWALAPADRPAFWWLSVALVLGLLLPSACGVGMPGSGRRGPRWRRLRALWRAAVPALCALGAVAVLVLLLYANSYLDWSRGGQVEALHEAVRKAPVAAFAQHDAGRGYRGLTMGLTVLTALVAAWTAAGAWWRNRRLHFSGGVTLWVGLLAAALGIGLAALGMTHHLLGFGGAAGNTLLCAAWRRDGTPGMAILTDAFNTVGIYLPVVLALGVCLLLEPVMARPWPRVGPVLTLRRKAAAEKRLNDIAERTRDLDTLIYLGAVGLVFGTLQISATYNAALAYLPAAGEAKATAELCKAVGGLAASAPAAASATSAASAAPAPRTVGRLPAPEKRLGCTAAEIADTHLDAAIGDSARRFARQTTLTFGLAFSIVLLALYLSATLLLHAAAVRVAQQGLGLDRVEKREELLKTLGIESDYVGKLGRLIAALSPLAAGLVTSALAGA